MIYDSPLSTGREACDKETIVMHPLKMQSQELPQCLCCEEEAEQV